jgi:hypothetical protein
MSILSAWSDVTRDGDDFLDGGPENEVDFGFLFTCCSVAVPRNQDDSMYILEESWIPVWSFAVGRLWVPEIGERILLLTDYEGICCTQSSKRGIIDPQLKKRIFMSKHFSLALSDLP